MPKKDLEEMLHCLWLGYVVIPDGRDRPVPLLDWMKTRMRRVRATWINDDA